MQVGAVLAHAASTLLLTGLIWTIQVLHYPLFAEVGADRFVAYEAAHSARITLLIAVPWAVQGITTLWLLVAPPAGVPSWLVWLAGGLAAVPVLVTLVWSVPAHEVLGDGFDAAAHARLVSTNWLRTAAWSLHSLVAGLMVVLALRGR